MKNLLSATLGVTVLLLNCVSGGRVAVVRQSSGSVQLTVFYKLNDAAHQFITNELYPTYLFVNQYSQRVRQRMTVSLVPIATGQGSSLSSEDRSLHAHSKIHACASSPQPAIFPDDWKRLNFIACASSPSYTSFVRYAQLAKTVKCAAEVCVDDTRLSFCANSADGDDLLNLNAATLSQLHLNLTDNPIVLLTNQGQVVGDFKTEDQEKALSNLMAFLCDKYPAVFDDCEDLPRVKSKKQFQFTEDVAYPLRRRCNAWHAD